MEKKSHNVDITVVSRQTAMVALPSASDSVLVTIKETAHKHSVVDKYKDRRTLHVVRWEKQTRRSGFVQNEIVVKLLSMVILLCKKEDLCCITRRLISLCH